MSILGGIRDAMSSPKALLQRQEIKNSCLLGKIAGVAFAVLLVALGALTGLAGLVIIGGLGIFIGREVYVACDNIQEIFDDPLTEIKARFSQDNMINQITKGTLLFKAILLSARPL